MSYNRNLMIYIFFIYFVAKFNKINVAKGSIYKLNNVQISAETSTHP